VESSPAPSAETDDRTSPEASGAAGGGSGSTLGPLRRVETGGAPLPTFRHFDLVMTGFVVVLLCSNLIGPGKTVRLDLWGFPLAFGAGNLFFPISYIFDDVLTEVYGYAHSRRAVWAGFFALVFATLMSTAIIWLPADPREPFNARLQPAIEVVFGNTTRIFLASILAFWAGDLANSYVLAKMKLLTNGRWLWTRTIGSTIVGEGVDSLLFYPIAFGGIWTARTLVTVVVVNWVFKVMMEVVLTPVTYQVIGWLKRAEGFDLYDAKTDFNPFRLEG
jgi:uncharacterized integral membrane protein (TIGR00697 family)